MKITRYPLNPIVRPGSLPWRQLAAFNPAVIRDDDGTFYMIERAAGALRPFQCAFGLLQSADGLTWKHVSRRPVLTAADLGFPNGSLQDPRLVKLDDRFLLVGVLRSYALDCLPNGIGVPEYRERAYAGRERNEPNISRSFIASSHDLRHWNFVSYCSDLTRDDRDNILFPEKIAGRYVLLRRPIGSSEAPHIKPGIRLSRSDDLKTWDPSKLIAVPEQEWEELKIGGSTPPVRTRDGWLALYHGVDNASVYRVGALLLDLADPQKVLARTRRPIMEPQEYYEKVGLVIPNVIFPAANLVVDDELWIYYGACDTSIALATISMEEILALLQSAETSLNAEPTLLRCRRRGLPSEMVALNNPVLRK